MYTKGRNCLFSFRLYALLPARKRRAQVTPTLGDNVDVANKVHPSSLDQHFSERDRDTMFALTQAASLAPVRAKASSAVGPRPRVPRLSTSARPPRTRRLRTPPPIARATARRPPGSSASSSATSPTGASLRRRSPTARVPSPSRFRRGGTDGRRPSEWAA